MCQNAKMYKKITCLLPCSLVIGAVALTAQNAQSQLYDNGTASTYNGNFNYNNSQAGNEIILAGSATSEFVSGFTVQFDLVSNVGDPLAGSLAGTEQVDLRFYKNDGAPVLPSGANAPGSLLYDSGFFSLD